MKVLLGRSSKILGRFPYRPGIQKSQVCADRMAFRIPGEKDDIKLLCTGPVDHEGTHEATGSQAFVYAFWDDDRETD